MRGLTLLAALAMASCTIGPDPGESAVATSPRGAEVEIRWNSPFQSAWGGVGELVSVSDQEIYVIHRSTIVRYPFGTPAGVRAHGVSGVGTLELTEPEADRLAKFRDYARYPFGLSDGRLAALAQAIGDNPVVTVDYFPRRP